MKYEGHAPGTFCWMELGTTDQEAAKTFYAKLFGWEGESSGGEPPYTMLRANGLDVGGLYQLSAEQLSQGMPPCWMSYIAVKSADDATSRAAGLGATVLQPAFDVMDYGRMAIIQDPGGATFAIWEARTHSGSKVKGEPNTLCWNELSTRDVAQAISFYSGLFGWATKTDGGPMPYTEIMADGQPIGGMMAQTPEQGDAPPNWLPYFSVEDCDAIAASTKELGGAVFVPPMDIPKVGRFAVLQDPQGAVFAVIKLG